MPMDSTAAPAPYAAAFYIAAPCLHAQSVLCALLAHKSCYAMVGTHVGTGTQLCANCKGADPHGHWYHNPDKVVGGRV